MTAAPRQHCCLHRWARPVSSLPVAPLVMRILEGDGRVASTIRPGAWHLFSAAITEAGLGWIADWPAAHRFAQVYDRDRFGYRHDYFAGCLQRGNLDLEGLNYESRVADDLRLSGVALVCAARRLVLGMQSGMTSR